MAFQTPQQGWGQQTPAIQQIIRSGLGSRIARSVRRASKRRSASSTKARSRKSSKRASGSTKRSGGLKRLVKGSAAAKAHMAKLRRMRK